MPARLSALNPAVGAHLADLLKVVEVAAHEEGGGRHEEVQHLPGQDGHEGVLPLQGVQVGHEALGHERQQSPAGREEHDAPLRQEAGEDLGDRRGQHKPEASRGCRPARPDAAHLSSSPPGPSARTQTALTPAVLCGESWF